MADVQGVPVALTDLNAKTAQFKHPLFIAFSEMWTKLGHVREGIGGFLDGTYLIAHPREWVDHKNEQPRVPTKKLKERRKLARYENFAATLIDQMKSALFRDSPLRVLGKYEGQKDREPQGIEAWWEDVDGRGTTIDDYLSFAWDPAATFGHVLLYMDRKGVTGETYAETPTPIVRAYAPLDIADWESDDQGNLLWVKLIEPPPPRENPNEAAAKQAKYRLRIVTRERWDLYDQSGKWQDGDAHHMGTLPCVLLFGKRRPLIPNIGQSVLYDPQLYIDLYNLTSELRELFRKQAFSILNIPLGTGPDAMDVEKAKALLQQEVGTEGVIFSGAAASFLSAAAENMTAYMEERDKLLRMIYRLAGVFFESDSLDAEAEGSLKLKREDMNQRLSGYADELEQADLALCKLWYRAQYGDRWEAEWDADEVTIQYPQTFDVTPFDAVLEQAQAAMSLGFPPVVLKAIRKRLLVKFLPDLGPREKQEMEDAIETSEDDVMPQETSRARLQNYEKTGKMPPKGEAA